RHAVLADVGGARVVVVDGGTGDAAGAPLSTACTQPAEIDAHVTGSREEPSCEQAEEARATGDGKVTLHKVTLYDGSSGQAASIARDMRARPAHTTPPRQRWPMSIALSRWVGEPARNYGSSIPISGSSSKQQEGAGARQKGGRRGRAHRRPACGGGN